MRIIVWVVALIIGGTLWIVIVLKATSSVPELVGVAVACPTLLVLVGLVAHAARRIGEEGEYSAHAEKTTSPQSHSTEVSKI
jgi:hypothetical protein